MPQERNVGADYEVTVTTNFNARKAVASDSLADTINYAEIVAIVKREMSIPSALLEHVAGRITRALLAKFPIIESGSITLVKLHPPISTPNGGASFHLSFSRH